MKSESARKFLAFLRQPSKSKEDIEGMEKVRVLFQKELAIEINDLLVELKNVGLSVKSIWDLVNMKKPYPEAIDILLKYLPRSLHDKNKEGIVRALTVKEAKGKAN